MMTNRHIRQRRRTDVPGVASVNEMMKSGRPTFGSLFAGIGGFDLGLERAGWQCKWQVEIDDYATFVLEKHWPAVPKYRDVRSFPPKVTSQWLRHRWAEEFQVDLVCAGFPCQDISNAGKREGIRGARSGLFFEIIRVAREIRPSWLLLENVAALTCRGLDVVLGELAEIGFDAEWHCIPAAAVGAPHIRDRIFVVAYSDRARKLQQKGSFPDKWRRIGNCGKETNVSDTDCGFGKQEGGGLFEKESQGRRKRARLANNRDHVSDTNIKRLPKWQGKDTKRTRQIIWTKPERSEWWASEPNVGRVAYGIPNRVDRIRCLGNAIVPQVAEFIGKEILKEIQR